MDIKRFLSKEVPAPLWKRIFAYLIDVVVLTLILLPLSPADMKNFSLDSFTSFPSQHFTWQVIFYSLFVLIITLAYWSILEYKYQQTLGKLFLKLKVISQTKQFTFKQALLRNVAKLSSLLLLLDCLYLFFKHTNQRYSETLAMTEVVEYHG